MREAVMCGVRASTSAALQDGVVHALPASVRPTSVEDFRDALQSCNSLSESVRAYWDAAAGDARPEHEARAPDGTLVPEANTQSESIAARAMAGSDLG